MTARILVAGIGNVFLGDDGFGVEVARHLAALPLPPDVVVRDVGIRGVHLAYELADGWDLLVFVDAVSRGGPPGTLHVLEPQGDRAIFARDAHGMDLDGILATARSLGAPPCAVIVVGCDVLDVAEGIGLSPAIQAAVPEAARTILALVAQGMPASPR